MKTQQPAQTILQARADAQHLAFGPMVFQAVRQLWKSGMLAAIENTGQKGITTDELAEQTGISGYGAGVLCEVAVSAGVVTETADRFTVTKLGSVLLHDRLTQVNFDFVHDVCYQGSFYLEEAIREGKPAGLKVFSEAETIYQCITELPEAAQQSWYAFDHFYSDRAFKEAAGIVFHHPVERLLDIGGNTGKWAHRVLKENDRVTVTIADLPGQLERARQMLNQTPFAERMSYFETDILKEPADLPGEFDAVWMSQFLDCFSEAQIGQILTAVRPTLTATGRLYIMETLVDRQRYEAASYSLNAISLYFTAMANGNSRMYRGSTLERILTEQGFVIETSFDDLGLGHTLLECRPA